MNVSIAGTERLAESQKGAKNFGSLQKPQNPAVPRGLP